MIEKKNLKTEKRRITLRDVFKNYPYKKISQKNLIKGGSDYFPKEEIKDDHKFSVDRKEFMLIAEKLFDHRFKSLLKGNEIKLPLRSGKIKLMKCKSNKKYCDFKATNIYRKLNPGSNVIIYHKNYHSQGYKPLLIWSKETSVMVNKSIFMFRLTRDRNRELASHFKNKPNEISNLNTL